ncbi:uncharacterized protein LOC120489360 isoform X2 [Pimephales promelas]|uniref:uncharacterized protein LOC120489360 isoform X2 n=1 Tax=Pimephales promelas TaxID=90988 RepID=UPI001955B103|nr:uncharacterized protein LOC120489360 isoform X2 [Pimephales promelas]
MAFIKEESEDMKVEETFSEDIKILETFSMKQEETEEQTKMAFIKEESEDMQIEETFSVKQEETEKQTETRRNAYDAAFKLKAIDLAAEKGNRAAARELGLNESMIRRWKQQREELTQCKKTTKAFRGNKSRWPELENELEDWVNTQRAGGRGVSTVQIRLKAKRIATAMKLEDFSGGPSWCLRFMRRKGLSIRVRTSLCQQLPPDYEEKVSNFHKFTDAKIAAHSIGLHNIINMDEVPLTFDLPLTRTVNRKGESSVTLKTNGHEKTHFTCVLSCTASGEKLPPMVIFKRTTMPKENFPIGIVVKVNKEGWMTESLMHEWHTECYGKRPGGLFHRNKALLVLDSMRAHITDSVKEAIKRSNSIPAVIPGGTTKYLHPLDINVNRAFKVALRVQWEAWMTRREKSFTKTGRIRRATYGQVCQWVLTAWNNVKKSTIINGFRKAGLLRVEEGSVGDLPPDESDESDNENDPISDEAILRRFNSDTEGEDFDGFSAQEEEDRKTNYFLDNVKKPAVTALSLFDEMMGQSKAIEHTISENDDAQDVGDSNVTGQSFSDFEDDAAPHTAFSGDGNEPTFIPSQDNTGDEVLEPPKKKFRVSISPPTASERPSNNSKIPPLGVPCDINKCTKQCTIKISHDRRKEILDAYWSRNLHERKSWIFSSISKAATKKHSRTSRRKLTYSYHFKDENGQSHAVCKLFFIATLGYNPKNDRFITTVVQSESLESVMSSRDRRGMHVPSNKLNYGPIKDHIESYGPSISHSQHAPKRRYLASDITVKFMHEDFKEKNPGLKCSYEAYRKVIRELNIRFTKPGEEECEKCVRIEIHAKAFGHEQIIQSYKGRTDQTMDGTSASDNDDMETATDKQSTTPIADKVSVEPHMSMHYESISMKTSDEQTNAENQATDCPECMAWIKHKKAANIARRHYEEDSGKDWPDDWSVRSADLQKVVMLPRLPGNKTAIFTKRLVAYHETFATVGIESKQMIKKKPTLSVVWHEGIAGCSAEEITSAFITALMHDTERGIKHAVIWADNCTAQNKNWSLLTSLVTLVNSKKTSLEKITLKFFEPGHTLMSADSIHHGVELGMKRCPGGKLFDFDDFVRVIKYSSSNIEIIRLENKNILAWKGGQSQSKLSQAVSKLAEMVEIQARRGSKDLFFKTSHDDTEHCKLDFLKKNLKKNTLQIPACLREKDKGVSLTKKAEIIKKLIPLMPENRRRFWRELTVAEDDEDAMD